MTLLLFTIAATPYSPVGRAVICAQARYASVLYGQDSRMDRRFATVGLWGQVEAEERHGFAAGALPSTSAVVTVLLNRDRRGVSVEHVNTRNVEVPELGAAEVLDSELTSVEGR